MNKQLKNLILCDAVETFAESAERLPPKEILLVKYGTNKYTKEGHRGEFTFTEADADAIIRDFAERGKDLVIDYEHQTLSGSAAPAAGWISSLSKTPMGLVAKVKYWTEQAAKYLLNGEYRYFSPVLNFSSRRGEADGGSNRALPASVHSVAITNHPALHNIPALVAADTGADDSGISNNNNNEVKMKELIKVLGLVALSDSAPEAQAKGVAAEVEKLLGTKKEVAEFLKLHDADSLDKVTGKIQGMCPVTEKQAIEATLKKRDAETAVAKAFSDGKLAEKSKVWAQSFAEKDLQGFKDWAEGAPVIVPDNKNIDAQAKPVTKPEAFSDSEMKIFRTLGLTDEQIAKMKENK